MTALTFDTYAAVKQMKESGLAETHAESIVAAIQAGMGHLADLATKADLKNCATKADLKDFATKEDLKNFATKEDIKAIEAELKNFATKEDLELLQQRMTIRLGVMLSAVAALAIAAARLFF